MTYEIWSGLAQANGSWRRPLPGYMALAAEYFAEVTIESRKGGNIVVLYCA